jgi:hypothetical protein
MRPYHAIIAVALAAAAVAGCSFIDSSESISKSVSGSFESSSSSSPGDSESAYRDDVRDYTYAYVRSGGSAGDFDKGLGEMAKKHGISSWEADRATWIGVGEGLAKARVSRAELEAYKRTLGGADPDHMAAIEKGYEGYKA